MKISSQEGKAKLRKNTRQVKALRASRIGVFVALYVATSLIPISMFIGTQNGSANR